MDFQNAVDYILSFADYERLPRSAVVFDLRRMNLLLERLGNPHLAAKAVHITGTKGKGSTSAMIASVLSAAGYRTGSHTSPHLLSIRERIKVDGAPIPEEAFARLTAVMKPEVETINKDSSFGSLTTFELLTALGFLYFREMKADYQVQEVGLGGRLDATNVVKPEVCVITSISYDHMDVLGETLEKIATEKAGIIKSGCMVVTSPQVPEAKAVLERVCQEKGARLVKVGEEVTWRRTSFSPEGQSFSLKGLRGEYKLSIPLVGEYQIENAAVAVATIECLIERGAKVKVADITRGLARVRWEGRLQVLRRKPWLVVDGAHNANSTMRLVKALKDYFTYDRAILIFGASHEKDIGGMVAELASLGGKVIVTRTRHPRAARTDVLAGEFSKHGIKAEVAEAVGGAIEKALAEAGADDLIIATGSLFLVAEVMEYVRKCE